MLAIRRDDPYSCSDGSVGVSVHKIDSVNLGQKLNLLFRRRMIMVTSRYSGRQMIA